MLDHETKTKAIDEKISSDHGGGQDHAGDFAVHNQRSLKRAVAELKIFAKDAALANLFGAQTQDSELSFEADERFDQLCKLIEPSIGKEEMEISGIIGRKFANLRCDIEDIAWRKMSRYREAGYFIGVFVGCMAADPTGRVLEAMGEAFVRYQLAQPRHFDLATKIQASYAHNKRKKNKKRTEK